MSMDAEYREACHRMDLAARNVENAKLIADLTAARAEIERLKSENADLKESIRALRTQPAAPDPTRALARLFAAWVPFIRGTTAPYCTDVNAAIDAGLLSGSRPYLGGTGCELTDLGRAALALAEDK